MEERIALLPEARRILDLAKQDRGAAERALEKLSLEDQVAVACEARPADRVWLLALMPNPDQVIPRLPEAELCFTVKAVGLGDAAWLMEYASADQLMACLDLDAWSGLTPDRAALEQWVTTLSEAGEETLLRAAHNLDPELLVLYLRDRVDVALKPGQDAAEDWSPPDGSQTLDGQFYFAAKREGDDIAPILRMLDALFRKDYWLYFRLLQGCIWEIDIDLEEWALRWRAGRLEDLGFPSSDESLGIYGFIRPEKRAELPASPDPLRFEEWRMPVWLRELPIGTHPRHSVFRCLAELDTEERRSFFYAFVSISNKVAVADHMPLGDSETLPTAIEKAAVLVSRGLEYLAGENRIELADALRRVPLEHLFRVGANLEADPNP